MGTSFGKLFLFVARAVRALSPVVLAVALVSVVGCYTEQPRWPWSTQEDTVAAIAELSKWRQVFDPRGILAETLELNISAGLFSGDSSSPTGETLYKFAHLLRAWYEPGDMMHSDDLCFGVTADSGVRTDTFCHVRAYRDSIPECRLSLLYDSLWVVGYRPETIIDTTRTPWDTTVTYKVNSVTKRGFDQTQVWTKVFHWVVKRQMFMRKVDSVYVLKRVSGARSTMPSVDEAPVVSWIAMMPPGRSDTFRYSATPGGKHINNLCSIDSLYTLSAGERFTVVASARTPEDTTTDANRFYVILNGRRTEITKNRRRGEGEVFFGIGDTGYQHIYLEVLSWRNLLYPQNEYGASVWAIPVRVSP
ncbi:MAG: hypothetical protein ABIK43_06775 [candidate division WOR-3 bacterium]